MLLLLVLLIFVVAPIVELTILIRLGGWLGWLPTLALVFGAGLVGAAIARLEGLRAALRIRQQLAAGVAPAAEMVDGLLIAAAGVLLLLPGFVSDVLGLALLLPPVRKLVRRALLHWVRTRFRVQVIGGHDVRDDATAPARGDQIIDARVIETRIVD
jgi:UPF0716 protein FxsA